MPQDTQDEFLKDLQTQETVDIFEQPLNPEPPKPAEQAVQTQEDEEPRNRHERRTQAKLQAEREANIALAARLEAITEAQRASQQSEADEYLKLAEQIYGNQAPENALATDLLKKALKGAEERAYTRAVDAFKEEQRKRTEEEAKESEALDDMIDEVEDNFNVTMDSATQKTFFQLLEKLSPKDRTTGDVIAYADPLAVWEELQARKQQTQQQSQTRARDLASRGMTKTGAQAQTTVEQDSNERWLRENGII